MLKYESYFNVNDTLCFSGPSSQNWTHMKGMKVMWESISSLNSAEVSKISISIALFTPNSMKNNVRRYGSLLLRTSTLFTLFLIIFFPILRHFFVSFMVLNVRRLTNLATQYYIQEGAALGRWYLSTKGDKCQVTIWSSRTWKESIG